MVLLEARLGVRYGGSSGTNLIACLQLAARMRDAGETGSIVTLLCDRGDRYRETLYDPAWRASRKLDVAPWQGALAATLARGTALAIDGGR
jgi:cysteine synthase A